MKKNEIQEKKKKRAIKWLDTSRIKSLIKLGKRIENEKKDYLMVRVCLGISLALKRYWTEASKYNNQPSLAYHFWTKSKKRWNKNQVKQVWNFLKDETCLGIAVSKRGKRKLLKNEKADQKARLE